MTSSITWKTMADIAHIWIHPENGIRYAMWQDNGRTRRKSLKTTDERIANRRLNQFKRDLLAGKVKPISEGVKTLFNDFVDDFLANIEDRVTDSTYTLYDVALEKAKSCWGNIPLNHITTRHLDQFITDLLKAGLKPSTVNKNYRHLKAAIRQAIKWDLMKPLREYPRQLKVEEEVRFLSVEQLRALLDAIDDTEFYDFVLFAGYTGLRSGEILRLEFSDVDNPDGFLRISPQQKNKTASRIPINSNARAILNRCKKRQGKTGPLFRFRTLTWVSQKFRKYAVSAGLDKFRFHDLRHTFASHLAMAGEDIRKIQILMRHRSLVSTLVYANLSPESLRESSEKLNYGPMPAPKKKARK